MKTLITATVLAIFATTAQASEPMNCQLIGQLAEGIMKNRQLGGSMARAMEIAEGDPLMEEMVIMAYKRTRFHTESVQARAVEDFRDQWYLACVQQNRK